MIYVHQIIIPYTLNLDSIACQLYLNTTGRKKIQATGLSGILINGWGNTELLLRKQCVLTPACTRLPGIWGKSGCEPPTCSCNCMSGVQIPTHSSATYMQTFSPRKDTPAASAAIELIFLNHVLKGMKTSELTLNHLSLSLPLWKPGILKALLQSEILFHSTSSSFTFPRNT